jgi:hypothetical protein
VKEEIKYSIELKIDESMYTLTAPYGAPVTACADAAMHFYIIMKKKVDDYNKKLKEEGKLVELKTDDDKKEEVPEEESD